MDLTNIFLQSLLEAPGDNARNNRNRNRNNQNEDDPDAANEPDTQAEEDTDTDTTDEGDETTDDNTDTEGTDEETGENDDTEQGTEDEGEETDEQNNEEENTDTEGEGENNEDDFSLEDPTGEGEGEGGDDGPPPDGLTDPDDDGSSDDTTSGEEDPDAETNVHTNVLQLSKLDRLMAKRKCLNDFYDLRTSIDTFRVVIEKNEAILNPDVRDIAVRDLNKLYTTVGEYLTYRFGFTNYEENLQNYFLFLRSMNEIIRNVNEKGLEKTKSSRTDNIKD